MPRKFYSEEVTTHTSVEKELDIKVTRKITNTFKVTAEEFIQFFVEGQALLLKIKNKTDIRLLVALFKKAAFNSNEVFLVKSVKKELAEELEYSVGSIENSITRLTKMKAIIRKDTASYYLNPNFFFKGEIKKRHEIIQVVNTFIIE